MSCAANRPYLGNIISVTMGTTGQRDYISELDANLSQHCPNGVVAIVTEMLVTGRVYCVMH